MKNRELWFKSIRNIKGFLSFLFYKIKTMSFARNLLLIYLFITIIGSLLLYASFSQTGYKTWDPITNQFTKGRIKFLDSLFTAASAFSDTGLTTNKTAIAYNEVGQAIIAILILIGGIGFFALKVFIFNIIFNRPISFRIRESLAAERGSINIGVTKDLIKVAITFLLSIIIVFSIILSLIFYYADVSENSTIINNKDFQPTKINNNQLIYKNPYKNPYVAIKFGVFHTISALNNAGFDIIGNDSLNPYYYVIWLQIIFVILFVIGGIGYPVIYDLYLFIINWKKGHKFRFSLFTKLSVSTYFIISIIGLITAYWIEIMSNSSILSISANKYGTKSYKMFAIFFNTMSTRNAGFSTISMNNLNEGTLFLYIVLMFIGSAPSSTAGGIRTTTIAIIFMGIINFIRGKKNVYIFGRMIDNSTVKRSFVVFTVSILLLVFGFFISLSSLDIFGGKIETLKNLKDDVTYNSNKKYYSYVEILFEVGSAFGTTGLSSGITSKLSLYSKMTLILIMFVGQLGVSSSILIWGKKNKEDILQKYVSTQISIG